MRVTFPTHVQLLSNMDFYDNENRRREQVNLLHSHRGIGEHSHHGYEHDEYEESKAKGTRLTPARRKLVEKAREFLEDNLGGGT